MELVLIAQVHSTGTAAHRDDLVAALIVTTAVIALADLGRSLLFFNILFGAWVIAAPWVLGGATPASRWSDAIVAALRDSAQFPARRGGRTLRHVGALHPVTQRARVTP